MAEIDKSKFLAVGIFVLAVCLAAISSWHRNAAGSPLSTLKLQPSTDLSGSISDAGGHGMG